MQAKDLRFIPVTQHFDTTAVADVAGETRRQIEQSGVRFPPGGRIALCVGSRGIASLPQVVRAVADAVRAQNAVPFILPAMGSHGGATADGQRAVLHGYGVHEASMGCPILSSMEVVTVDSSMNPPVFMARDAWEADGVIVINRVKPHTDFHGPVESGLMKMLVIGLGKHAQALAIHRQGVHGLRDLMPIAARRVLATGKILLGVGLVENAYEQLRCIRACPADAIPDTDAALLALARESMPSLPLDSLDLLIVDRMGKDISGVGLDTNIIGRMRIPGEPEPARPRIRQIVVGSLTEASHGNATAYGLADVITQRLYDAIDWQATNENLRTSGFGLRGDMPAVEPTVADAVNRALTRLPAFTPDTIAAIHIPSTLELTHLLATPAAVSAMRTDARWHEHRIEADTAAIQPFSPA